MKVTPGQKGISRVNLIVGGVKIERSRGKERERERGISFEKKIFVGQDPKKKPAVLLMHVRRGRSTKDAARVFAPGKFTTFFFSSLSFLLPPLLSSHSDFVLCRAFIFFLDDFTAFVPRRRCHATIR